MTAEEEVKLFDAPDLAAIQRNWPRIALRASVLFLIPFLTTMLARSLELYPAISKLPLPLDLLAQGPFAYEAKVIFVLVLALMGLAFLVPKRTTQFVMAICVTSVLWTGHIYVTLQWARFFAKTFNFRREAIPGPMPWILATLLVLVGVAFLLLEGLLDTREQQEARKLAREDALALQRVALGTLGGMLGMSAAFGLLLVGGYLGLRALLVGVSLPFRLDPVFVLLGSGVALAILIALAARRRSPVG